MPNLGVGIGGDGQAVLGIRVAADAGHLSVIPIIFYNHISVTVVEGDRRRDVFAVFIGHGLHYHPTFAVIVLFLLHVLLKGLVAIVLGAFCENRVVGGDDDRHTEKRKDRSCKGNHDEAQKQAANFFAERGAIRRSSCQVGGLFHEKCVKE